MYVFNNFITNKYISFTTPSASTRLLWKQNLCLRFQPKVFPTFRIFLMYNFTKVSVLLHWYNSDVTCLSLIKQNIVIWIYFFKDNILRWLESCLEIRAIACFSLPRKQTHFSIYSRSVKRVPASNRSLRWVSISSRGSLFSA